VTIYFSNFTPNKEAYVYVNTKEIMNEKPEYKLHWTKFTADFENNKLAFAEVKTSEILKYGAYSTDSYNPNHTIFTYLKNIDIEKNNGLGSADLNILDWSMNAQDWNEAKFDDILSLSNIANEYEPNYVDIPNLQYLVEGEEINLYAVTYAWAKKNLKMVL
jgi:hypothetical protein